MIRTFLVIGLVALCAGGCKANSGSMVILMNTLAADGCVVSGSESQSALSRGLLHPDSETGYVFTPVVRSRVSSNKNSERLIFLEGADVHLDRIDGAAATEVAAFTSSFSGLIAPGASAGMAFEITPAGLDEGDYVAHIQVFGSLEDGDVESQVYDYPLRVSAAEFEEVVGECATFPEGEVGRVSGSSCNAYQDGSLPCCTDGDDVICPYVGTMPPE